MIFKAILGKVGYYALAHPEEKGCQILFKMLEEYNRVNHTNATLQEMLYAFDDDEKAEIAANGLQAFIPNAFPKHLRPPVELNVHKNALGAWRVDPKETVNE